MDLTLFLFASIAAISASEAIPDGDWLPTREESSPPMVKYESSRFLPSNINHQDGFYDLQFHTELGIIGGKTTNISQHPYQVAIDNGKVFVCAGALLNRIWVVALASCTAGAHIGDLSVRVGSDSNVYGGTVYNVSDIVVHPNFNYSNMDYDFSLVKLSTYMCFDKDVSQIQFSVTPPQNQYVGTVSGWGSDGKNSTSRFKELKMRAIYNKWCASKYTVTHDVITDRMFCAVAGKTGPCFNDFGDPFVVNGTLYGLYSWSRGCANPGYPAVFASLSAVKDWIHTVMNNACFCGVY